MELISKLHKHLLFTKIRMPIDKLYTIGSNKKNLHLQSKHIHYINNNFNIKRITQDIKNKLRNEIRNN